MPICDATAELVSVTVLLGIPQNFQFLHKKHKIWTTKKKKKDLEEINLDAQKLLDRHFVAHCLHRPLQLVCKALFRKTSCNRMFDLKRMKDWRWCLHTNNNPSKCPCSVRWFSWTHSRCSQRPTQPFFIFNTFLFNILIISALRKILRIWTFWSCQSRQNHAVTPHSLAQQDLSCWTAFARWKTLSWQLRWHDNIVLSCHREWLDQT